LVTKKNIFSLILVFYIFSVFSTFAKEIPSAHEDGLLPTGVILPEFLPIGYSGKEELDYDVSWSGGIKIGELHLNIRATADREDSYEIDAVITTKNGAVNFIYPINDRHLTKVQGGDKLPYYSEVWQKEGFSYEAHKVLKFDQIEYKISTERNGKSSVSYLLEGVVNNEFSSFFNSRLMEFTIGRPFIVPTFADKKRVEVVVHPVSEKILEDTVLGDVSTVSIMPLMEFKGLYDKRGDTVIWYTNDECRVPVKINSKIAIGSLTAKLTRYKNPACRLYPEANIN